MGFTYGFAAGLATAAFWGWGGAYYGGAYYHPAYWGGGYGCCASASANVYGHWGNTAYSGTRSWYAGGGVAGSTASGSYANARTGTTGNYAAGRQYNAWTGNATRGYDRTVNGPDGGSGNVARAGTITPTPASARMDPAPRTPVPAAARSTARRQRPQARRAPRTPRPRQPTTPAPARPTPGPTAARRATTWWPTAMAT
ncbi:MAG: hypothetical protein IPH64_03870 [Comamonadaceae bacterium]|nr:hypothetical protein [Comamonadaceae bacterium]